VLELELLGSLAWVGLPLITTNPAVTFLATQHHCPLTCTKLYCSMTAAHVREQLARSHYVTVKWPTVKPKSTFGFCLNWSTWITSCAPGNTICLHPLQVDNIFVFIRQVAPVLTCWLFKTSATVDLWPFDIDSGVRVTCDVGYLCANFSLPRPVCSRVRPDVCVRRQTDRRQTKASLNALCPMGRRHNNKTK